MWLHAIKPEFFDTPRREEDPTPRSPAQEAAVPVGVFDNTDASAWAEANKSAWLPISQERKDERDRAARTAELKEVMASRRAAMEMAKAQKER